MECGSGQLSAARPRLGISACLMGERVRYDGAHKALGAACGLLDEHFALIRVCPEVAIGLGVPRPPLQLVEQNGAVRVLGVDDRDRDVTDALAACAADTLRHHQPFAGYVFKSRSPSCGLYSVPVHRLQGAANNAGRGAYADALLQRCPDLPALEEEALANAHALERFFTDVYARHRFLQCSDTAARRDFHDRYALALRARHRSGSHLPAVLAGDPPAYLGQLLTELNAPVVREEDASIMRELCAAHAPPPAVGRYAEGSVPRHVAIEALQEARVAPTDADWFLEPFPYRLLLCASD